MKGLSQKQRLSFSVSANLQFLNVKERARIYGHIKVEIEG